MPIRQKLVAIILSVLIFVIIVELVRRRRLKEEYSFLWLFTGALLMLFAFWYALLVKITYIIGAGLPTSTLFFFAILFVILVCLHFSVRLSKLHDQIKDLAQTVTLLENEIKEKK